MLPELQAKLHHLNALVAVCHIDQAALALLPNRLVGVATDNRNVEGRGRRGEEPCVQLGSGSVSQQHHRQVGAAFGALPGEHDHGPEKYFLER